MPDHRADPDPHALRVEIAPREISDDLLTQLVVISRSQVDRPSASGGWRVAAVAAVVALLIGGGGYLAAQQIEHDLAPQPAGPVDPVPDRVPSDRADTRRPDAGAPSRSADSRRTDGRAGLTGQPVVGSGAGTATGTTSDAATHEGATGGIDEPGADHRARGRDEDDRADDRADDRDKSHGKDRRRDRGRDRGDNGDEDTAPDPGTEDPTTTVEDPVTGTLTGVLPLPPLGTPPGLDADEETESALLPPGDDHWGDEDWDDEHGDHEHGDDHDHWDGHDESDDGRSRHPRSGEGRR